MYCSNCGTQLEPNTRFCHKCGTEQDLTTQAVERPTPEPEATPEMPPQPQKAEPIAPPPDPLMPEPKATETPVTSAAVKGRETPLSVMGYMITMVVLLLPLIGPIMALIWSFSRKVNINRQNFARAILILGVVSLILISIAFYYFQSMLLPMMEGMEI